MEKGRVAILLTSFETQVKEFAPATAAANPCKHNPAIQKKFVGKKAVQKLHVT